MHRTLAAVALCLALAAPLAAQQSPGRPARYGLDRLPCDRFTWNDDKTVMHVPITMNSHVFRYQLDTGADEVIPYGSTQYPGWTAKQEGVRIPNVTFAGMTLPAIVAYRMPQVPDSDVQGTVGLDLLVGHVFIIDFPRQTVCLLNKADLPDELEAAADWTPAEVRHGKLFLTLQFNHRPLPDIFYDTGSSPSALYVDLPLWRRLTRRHGISDARTHGCGLSWGKPIQSIGALTVGSLKLGSQTFINPNADTQPGKPAVFRQQDRANGLLGNALFRDSIVILDLGSHAQFGLVAKPQQP